MKEKYFLLKTSYIDNFQMFWVISDLKYLSKLIKILLMHFDQEKKLQIINLRLKLKQL